MTNIISDSFIVVNRDYIYEGVNYNPALEEYEVWIDGEVVAWADEPEMATRSYQEEVGAYNDHLATVYELPCGCKVRGDEFCRHQWEAELRAADREA